MGQKRLNLGGKPEGKKKERKRHKSQAVCGLNCVWASSLHSNSTDVVRAGGEKTLQTLCLNSPNSISITAKRFTCSTVRVAIKTEQASTFPLPPTSTLSSSLAAMEVCF